MTPTPLFILSIQRSGSTLLQRVLGAHPGIATTAEPWVLLPLVFSLRENGSYTAYRQENSARAIRDFCDELPDGVADYRAELAGAVRRLYEKAAPGDARYFLDKTPRYHLIARELFDWFPEARFIFLWRNPLAILASMAETYEEGRWDLYGYTVDLCEGLANLIGAWREQGDRAISVNYESFIANPDAEAGRIFGYLGLPHEPEVLSSFTETALRGRMKDPTGIDRYRTLSSEPTEKWRSTLNNPFRRAWARKYLARLGPDDLQTIGYDHDELLRELQNTPTDLAQLAPDVLRALRYIPRGRIRDHALRRLPTPVFPW